MTPEEKEFNRLLIEKVKNNLLKNGFQVIVCEDRKEAIVELKKMIGTNDTIGFGGSRTLEEIGFFEEFPKNIYLGLLDRRRSDLTTTEKISLQKRAMVGDVFLASANALSIDGELVFIDKWGNRNGAMTYGPKKRIVIVGVNKICDSLESAIHRAKNVSSVLNNIRFQTGNPCTKGLKCFDCDSENRLCSVMTIISRCPPPEKFYVFIINEKLGF